MKRLLSILLMTASMAVPLMAYADEVVDPPVDLIEANLKEKVIALAQSYLLEQNTRDYVYEELDRWLKEGFLPGLPREKIAATWNSYLLLLGEAVVERYQGELWRVGPEKDEAVFEAFAPILERLGFSSDILLLHGLGTKSFEESSQFFDFLKERFEFILSIGGKVIEDGFDLSGVDLFSLTSDQLENWDRYLGKHQKPSGEEIPMADYQKRLKDLLDHYKKELSRYVSLAEERGLWDMMEGIYRGDIEDPNLSDINHSFRILSQIRDQIKKLGVTDILIQELIANVREANRYTGNLFDHDRTEVTMAMVGVAAAPLVPVGMAIFGGVIGGMSLKAGATATLVTGSAALKANIGAALASVPFLIQGTKGIKNFIVRGIFDSGHFTSRNFFNDFIPRLLEAVPYSAALPALGGGIRYVGLAGTPVEKGLFYTLIGLGIYHGGREIYEGKSHIESGYKETGILLISDGAIDILASLLFLKWARSSNPKPKAKDEKEDLFRGFEQGADPRLYPKDTPLSPRGGFGQERLSLYRHPPSQTSEAPSAALLLEREMTLALERMPGKKSLSERWLFFPEVEPAEIISGTMSKPLPRLYPLASGAPAGGAPAGCIPSLNDEGRKKEPTHRWIVRRDERGKIIGIFWKTRDGGIATAWDGEQIGGESALVSNEEEESAHDEFPQFQRETLSFLGLQLAIFYKHEKAREQARIILHKLETYEAAASRLKELGDVVLTPMVVDMVVEMTALRLFGGQNRGGQNRGQTQALEAGIHSKLHDVISLKLEERGFGPFLPQDALPTLKEALAVVLADRGLIDHLIDEGIEDLDFLEKLEVLDMGALIESLDFDLLPLICVIPPDIPDTKDIKDTALSPTPSHQRFLEAIYEPAVGKMGFIPFEIEGGIRRLRPVTVDGLSGFEIRSAYRVYEILFDPNLVSPPFLFPASDAEPRRLIIRDPGKLGEKGIKKVQSALQRLIRADVYLNRYLRAPDFEKEFVLNPYQEEGLLRLRAHRASGGKTALVVLPTGLGKTALFVEDAIQFVQDHPEAKILVVVDMQTLASQLATAFEEGWRRAQMRDPALPSKTVGTLFSGETSGLSSDIVIALRQSLVITNGADQVTGIRHFSRDRFDMLILDEAHHVTNDSLQTISNYFDVDFTLGVTATPEDIHRRHFGNEREGLYEVYSQEAMDGGFLCDVAIRRPESKNPSPEEVAAEYLKVRSQFREEETVRTVIFTKNIDHAKAVEKAFLDRGIKAQRLTSESHPAHWQKKGAIERFELGDFEVLVVVDVLKEGIDIPAIDLVFFLRKTQSLRVYLQQLGRGLRVAPGKDVLYVVDWVNNELFARLRGGENGAIRLSLNIRRDLQREQIRRGRRAFTTEAEKRYRDFCKWYMKNLIERWGTVVSMPYHLGQARAEWEQRTGTRFEAFGKHIPPVMLKKIKAAFPPVYFIDHFDRSERSPWMQQLVVLMEFWKKDPGLSLTEIVEKYNREIRYTRSFDGRRALLRQDLNPHDVEEWIREIPALISVYEPEIQGLEAHLSPKEAMPRETPPRETNDETSVTPEPETEEIIEEIEETIEESEPSVSEVTPQEEIVPQEVAALKEAAEAFVPPTEEEVGQALGLGGADLAEKLSRCRDAVIEAMVIFNISQTEIGRMIQLSHGSLSGYFTGNVQPAFKKYLPRIIIKIIEWGGSKYPGLGLKPSDFESVDAIRTAISRHEGRGELGGIARCRMALDFNRQENINAYGQAIALVREYFLIDLPSFSRKIGMTRGQIRVAEKGIGTAHQVSSQNQPKIIVFLIGMAREHDVEIAFEDFESEARIREKFKTSAGEIGVIARVREKYGFNNGTADHQALGRQIKESRIALGFSITNLGLFFSQKRELAMNFMYRVENGTSFKENQAAVIGKLIIFAHERGIKIGFEVDMHYYHPSASPRSDDPLEEVTVERSFSEGEEERVVQIKQELGFENGNPNLSEIGEAIQLLRKTVDISSGDLAICLGFKSYTSITYAETGRPGAMLNQPLIIAKLMTMVSGRVVSLEIGDFKDRASMETKLLSDPGEIGLRLRVQKKLFFDEGGDPDLQAIGKAIQTARRFLGFSSQEKLSDALGEEMEKKGVQFAESNHKRSRTSKERLISKLILMAKARGIVLEIEDFNDPARITQKFQ